MIYVYILKNRFNKFYIGITKLSPEKRLIRHNRGYVYSTKFTKPWKMVYYEKYNDYKSARKREKQIKSWHGGNAFKKFLDKAAGSSNGRTPGFDPGNPGSNPGPAALFRSKKFGGVK